MPIEAVIFDMDGVLIDSEVYWSQARQEFARDVNRVWTDADHRFAMGRSTLEWGRAMQERLKIDMPVDDIIANMKQRMMAKYEAHMPLRPGALEAVHLAARHFRVGLASGSPTDLIRHVMRLTGLDQVFEVIVFGDDLPNGKPAPDIYLEALRQLEVKPSHAVGVEDSAAGIRSLHAAGMAIIAAPSPDFTLPADVLRLAHRVIHSLEDFSLELVQGLSSL